MRISRTTIAVALVGILFVLVLGTRFKRKQTSAPKETATMVAEDQMGNPAKSRGIRKATNDKMTLPREVQLQRAATSLNVPIDFWGIIKDQDDLAVAGANVFLAIRQWSAVGEIAGAKHQEILLTSDSDGRFEVHGQKGDLIAVRKVERNGYIAPRSSLREYGFNLSTNVSVDPERPVIIRVFRTTDEAKLQRGKLFFHAVPDGRVYSMDLKTGKLVQPTATTDLRISVSRPESIRGSPWSFSLQAPGGGLVECTQEDPFRAPADGYTGSISISSTEFPNTPATIEKQYFIKTASGQYGFAKIEVYGWSSKDDAAVSAVYKLNTNSSPVLMDGL
jgi:hypothetical protein